MKIGTLLLIGIGVAAVGGLYLYSRSQNADPAAATAATVPELPPTPVKVTCPKGYTSIKNADGSYTCKRVTLSQKIINTVAKIDPQGNGAAVNGLLNKSM